MSTVAPCEPPADSSIITERSIASGNDLQDIGVTDRGGFNFVDLVRIFVSKWSSFIVFSVLGFNGEEILPLSDAAPFQMPTDNSFITERSTA